VPEGAKLSVGGRSLGGNFFEPRKTLGPVAPLLRFKIEEEAIEMVNATEFGIACYFYESWLPESR
jgi:succinate-semialdehyde dehydrogenase / glutarate-semialdehyde dehydrogenase